LEGGGGNDRMSGGRGADIFIFNGIGASTLEVDDITDFKVGVDTIRLDGYVQFQTFADLNLLQASGVAILDLDDRTVFISTDGALTSAEFDFA
jgi:Ca2+-binding RTX toxin-like protein